MSAKSNYESISITVEDGEMRYEYLPVGGKLQRMVHDEDVSDWTQAECITCVAGMLDLTEDEVKTINFAYA